VRRSSTYNAPTTRPWPHRRATWTARPGPPSTDNWWSPCGTFGARRLTATATTAARPRLRPPRPSCGCVRGIWSCTARRFDQMLAPRTRQQLHLCRVRNGGNAIAAFCTSGDRAMQRRECAAFFANAALETGQGRTSRDPTSTARPGTRATARAAGGFVESGCDCRQQRQLVRQPNAGT